jgi:uncharacterized iron-regulated membrane protein
LEKAPQPTAIAPRGAAPIGVDAAISRLQALGLERPFSIALPESPQGAYVGDYRPDRIEDSRTIYLDPYTGRVLKDVGFRDWGVAAKAIEWGIAVHQGQQYGPLNRWLMLAGCGAIVLLAVSAVVMWWKRRPRGSLGAPPAPTDPRVMRAVAGAIALVGVIYPLVGASFLAALAADALIGRLRRARAV